MRSRISSLSRRPMLFCASALTCLLASTPALAMQKDIVPPSNAAIVSVDFGAKVYVLPNGNFVVTDPSATVSGLAKAGAVYLYHADGTLISTLTGSHANDQVGYGAYTGTEAIAAVGASNFVVVSSQWNNG